MVRGSAPDDAQPDDPEANPKYDPACSVPGGDCCYSWSGQPFCSHGNECSGGKCVPKATSTAVPRPSPDPSTQTMLRETRWPTGLNHGYALAQSASCKQALAETKAACDHQNCLNATWNALWSKSGQMLSARRQINSWTPFGCMLSSLPCAIGAYQLVESGNDVCPLQA